jgi:P-type E1-E2 ATPase
MNGTIAVDGKIEPALKSRLAKLKTALKIFVVTADTFGTASEMATKLGLECHLLPKKKRESEEKLDFVKSLGSDRVVAMGNGNNDLLMIKEAAFGIGVLGHEGIAIECLHAADIIVQNPKDGLDLLLKSLRVTATLRG